MSKTLRNLSGCYFFGKDEHGERIPVCFEELSEEEQDAILQKKDAEYLRNMVKMFCKVINNIGDTFDIVRGEHETNNN